MSTATNSHDISAQVAELRAEMRSENANTRRTLERVAAAVDKLSAIEAQNTARDSKLADHEARLRRLEANWLKFAGVLALLSAVGPALAHKLGWL